MPTDISTLEKGYFEACKRQGIAPNKAIVAALFKAKIKKARHEMSTFMVLMDDLKDVDFYPLLYLLKEIDASEIDAVDMRSFSTGVSMPGPESEVLSFSEAQYGWKFVHMHTLNLDFSTSLSGFREDCFSSMPNLRLLSLCETRITNLWTTSAALSKLPSLDELRFQNCSHSNDAGCPSASSVNEGIVSGRTDLGFYIELPSPSDDALPNLQLNIDDEDLDDYEMDARSTNTDSSDDSEVDFSGYHRDFGSTELYPNIPLSWSELADFENEISFGSLDTHDEDSFSGGSFNSSIRTSVVSKKYISRNPSPICYEKHYREYMIASLPNLKVLDNLPIGSDERGRANDIFTHHFEYLPYNRRSKDNVVSMLQKHRFLLPKWESWPTLHPLSIMGGLSRDERRSFRPRQFEYHPTDSRLMVFGTLDGEVVVINHESEKIVNYIPSLGAMNSVLGLCWLKKYPSKPWYALISLHLGYIAANFLELIAGSDNGSLRLYDIQHMPTTSRGMSQNRGNVIFDEFDQLTSVHVNSTDELFLASGYSKNVALYDISSGKRLQDFADMHQEHINVVKFSNHSPSLFATSSFDQNVKMWDIRQKPNQPCYTASSSRGNVMVCFSPDDHYLLVSAVDNEVRQLLAVDGRLHLNFGIASTGSSQNYTRSYYMNGRDYVISGSCDEHVVRVCCANTGRRLRDVSLEGKGAGSSMFVQSLRGDPFRDFSMSVLAAYIRPSSNSEIVKVNLLESGDSDKSNSYKQQFHSVTGMGG
ncbi:hypothetical protein SASPL_132004 [Salvia splendens]|uniref:U2A'/phosphoprotein 32 family A C-terminal domain-containing protein n=1 Tax=Salvia splendens TaxID=180675 RepID=A0A8X8XC63_SALSN|nr:hypothetical protein SASPL_132004 [Salvia splendens]